MDEEEIEEEEMDYNDINDERRGLSSKSQSASALVHFKSFYFTATKQTYTDSAL